MFDLVKGSGKMNLLAALLVVALLASTAKAQISNLPNSPLQKSKIEYQFAAQFSALSWQNTLQSPVAISLQPLKNYSGIPVDANAVKPEYYEHGKLPQSIQRLIQDLALSTRLLDNSQQNPDVVLQMTLNQYSHPFKYAPDDRWYRKLKDQVDRWGITKKNAKVRLTLTMISKKHRFKPWVSSVESTLSHCDLNAVSHPLMPFNHDDDSLVAYTQSSMGQAFISASNYLLLQAVSHLNRQPQQAQVVSTAHNQLLLNSEHHQFVTGEKYQLIFNRSYPHYLRGPAGNIQVVKAMGNQAVAYPVDLRPDHIKSGDFVALKKDSPLAHPFSSFVAKNHCAAVSVAQFHAADQRVEEASEQVEATQQNLEKQSGISD